jgi:hypothetical protein
VEEQAQRFGGWGRKRGWLGWQCVAETFLFHLFCGGGETAGACILHGEEAEGLGERDAVRAGLKEFNLSADFAEDGLHGDVAHGSVGNRAFGEDGGTSGEREALKHANEAGIVDGKQRALAIGDADARGARVLTRLLRFLHDKPASQGDGARSRLRRCVVAAEEIANLPLTCQSP